MSNFLKLDGIDGDCVVSGYEDQIKCDSWNWGASNPSNMHDSTGGAAGSGNVADLIVTKTMDKASPNLYKACSYGRHFPEVTLTCTKSGTEGGDVKWLEIILKKVIISSVSSGSQADEMGDESISLNFAEYMVKFYPQESEGAEGASIDAGYNVATRTVV
ncbi:MAG: type VI secretion system tube protein Hcp [Xanthomonadales bacterium]|nr:type VI secretion system tube protein Hcp [Xanthomonadales bacterium]